MMSLIREAVEDIGHRIKQELGKIGDALDAPGSAILPSTKAGYRTASSFCARARRLATLDTCQCDPRAVVTLRSFRDRVIAPIVIAPSARSDRNSGSRLLARSSAAATTEVRPASPACWI